MVRDTIFGPGHLIISDGVQPAADRRFLVAPSAQAEGMSKPGEC
jgi:hypothetical protein